MPRSQSGSRLTLCVAREGPLGPRHHQLSGGKGSTDRITNHISLHEKLASLVRGEILLQSTKERGLLAGGALFERAEIFSPFPEVYFLWLWLPLKGSNEVGNLHTSFGIEGFQSSIDAG